MMNTVNYITKTQKQLKTPCTYPIAQLYFPLYKKENKVDKI